MGESHVERRRIAALLVDILAFLVAFVAAMELRFTDSLGVFEPGRAPWEPMLQSLPVVLGVWLLALRGAGAYQQDGKRMVFELARLMKALLVMAAILLSVLFFYRGFSYSRGFALLFLPSLLGLTFSGRMVMRAVHRHIDGLEGARAHVLLVGASIVAEHLIGRSKLPDGRLRVLGVLDDDLQVGTEVAGEVTVLGATEDLRAIAQEKGATGVIITASSIAQEKVLSVLDTCLALNLEWQLVPSAYELMLDRVTMDVVHGIPVLGVRRSNIRGANRLFKRALDIIIALLALVALSPLMIAVAILIKLTSRGPVLFSQDRVGENGGVFRFLKFRTMHVNNDTAIHREYAQQWIAGGHAHSVDDKGALYKIRKDPRIIPVGHFLRKYSIDELPQLFNVLRGDMSLIGPRPPIPYEVEVYRDWHRRRFEGPPGITGLWQVSGRNRLSFDEMVKLDIEYLENWSFSRDLKILWRTMSVVLFDRAY